MLCQIVVSFQSNRNNTIHSEIYFKQRLSLCIPLIFVGVRMNGVDGGGGVRPEIEALQYLRGVFALSF